MKQPVLTADKPVYSPEAIEGFKTFIRGVNKLARKREANTSVNSEEQAFLMGQLIEAGKGLKSRDLDVYNSGLHLLTIAARMKKNSLLTDVGDTALFVIEQNMGHITPKITMTNLPQSLKALEAAFVLSQFGSKSQQPYGRELLGKNIDIIDRGIQEQSDIKYRFATMLEPLIDYDNKSIADRASTALFNIVDSVRDSQDIFPTAKILSDFLLSDKAVVRNLGKRALDELFLKHFNVEFISYWGIWISEGREGENLKHTFAKNTERMFELNSQHPGIIAFLLKKYNHKSFLGNYNNEYIRRFKQYQASEKDFIPYQEEVDMLTHYGLDPQSNIDAWIYGFPHLLIAAIENTRAIHALETRHRGMTAVLQKEFGIKFFSRYPQELLIHQYEERDNKDTSYGVILYPQADHNGAFTCNTEVFSALYNQLNNDAAFFTKYGLRVVECDSKLSAVHRLNSMRKRYGPATFGIVGGHGTEGSIALGSKGKNNVIYISDFSRKGGGALHSAFIEHPTLILVSCTTGIEGGIGQKISELGAEIIAPDKPTNIETIFVLRNAEGKLTGFEVAYVNAGSTKVYANGEKVVN